MFAKVGAVHILGTFFGQGRIVMMPAIHDEITAPLQYGYTYPTEVRSQIPVEPLSEPIWREYERLWALRSSLGKGELQAIAFCKAEDALFLTNDRVARSFARDQGVQVLSLQALLRGLWVSGVHSKDEVRVLLERKRLTPGRFPPRSRWKSLVTAGPVSETAITSQGFPWRRVYQCSSMKCWPRSSSCSNARGG
jgi:predicted nucleic acid-binding protein